MPDIGATLKLARDGLLAVLAGVLLAWAVPVVIALVAAAPGLRTLILAIRASGLPRQEVWFTLTNFLPALLSSFAIGWATFRLLRGDRRVLWVAAAAPWVLNAIDFYVDLCPGTDASCLDPYSLAGLIVVPLGLLLAAAVCGPGGLAIQAAGNCNRRRRLRRRSEASTCAANQPPQPSPSMPAPAASRSTAPRPAAAAASSPASAARWCDSPAR